MDELEISGRRYLSTKRAAKENHYHADYIGQLIRGGKVVGTKVGRAWYVEEESLTAYLAGEGNEVSHAPVKQSNFGTSATPPTVRLSQEPTTLSTTNAPLMHKQYGHAVPITRVPITHGTERMDGSSTVRQPAPPKTNPLRYIADDQALFPSIQKTTHHIVERQEMVHTMPARMAMISRIQAHHTSYSTRPPAVSRALMIVGTIFIGGITFAAVLFISEKLFSRVVVEDGKPALADYSFE